MKRKGLIFNKLLYIISEISSIVPSILEHPV